MSTQPLKDHIDRHAAEELRLYIDNDAQLYNSQTVPCIRNVKRRMLKGTYDSEKAVKLWHHLVDAGAKKYCKEFGSSLPWFEMFNIKTRGEVARDLTLYYEHAIRDGEYDSF